MRTHGLSSPRLRELAQRPEQPGESEVQEHCELCGEPVAAEHRHLLDLRSHQLLCACRACSTLFDRSAAGGGHYRLIPDRRVRLEDFKLDDHVWEELRIPVDMACFYRNSQEDRVMAFYPSPMGATQSHLQLDAWQEIERGNEVLSTMIDDVEALLVNRTRGARDAWIVPIADCYRLVAIIRTRWRGLSGGKEVWLEIEHFFAELDERAQPSVAISGLGTERS